MDEELYHFGVKGMKWGVRKKRYSDYYQAKKQLRKTNRSLSRYKKSSARPMLVWGKATEEKKKKHAEKILKRYSDYVTNEMKLEEISKGKEFMVMYDFVRDNYYLGDRKAIENGTGNLITKDKSNKYRP